MQDMEEYSGNGILPESKAESMFKSRAIGQGRLHLPRFLLCPHLGSAVSILGPGGAVREPHDNDVGPVNWAWLGSRTCLVRIYQVGRPPGTAHEGPLGWFSSMPRGRSPTRSTQNCTFYLYLSARPEGRQANKVSPCMADLGIERADGSRA